MERSGILGEFCRLSGYHRTYAIALLGLRHEVVEPRAQRRRGVTYSRTVLRDRTDPFVLADALDRKLQQVARLHDGAAVAPSSTPNGTANVPMYTSITHAARVFRGDAASGRLAPLSPQRGQSAHPCSLEKGYASR